MAEYEGTCTLNGPSSRINGKRTYRLINESSVVQSIICASIRASNYSFFAVCCSAQSVLALTRAFRALSSFLLSVTVIFIICAVCVLCERC